VIIVHYDENEQIEFKVKSASKWSKGFDVSFDSWLSVSFYIC